MRKTAHILSKRACYLQGPSNPRWSSVHYACLECRVSFKKPRTDMIGEAETADFPCPNCKNRLQYMGRSFQAPRRTAVAQWRKVALLIQRGYRFDSAWSDPLPKTMRALHEMLNDEKFSANMTARRYKAFKQEQVTKKVGRIRIGKGRRK